MPFGLYKFPFMKFGLRNAFNSSLAGFLLWILGWMTFWCTVPAATLAKLFERL